MKHQKSRRTRSLVGAPHRRELLQRTRELSALLDFAEVATQSLDTQIIQNDTLDKSLESLGFKIGYIRILDVEAGGLVVRVARGLSSTQFMTNIVPLGSSHRSVGDIIFKLGSQLFLPIFRMIHDFDMGLWRKKG